MLPSPIRKFIDVFSALPSIGPRQAMRLAFHLMTLGESDRAEIANAVRGLMALSVCPDCFFFSEGAACPFCADPSRDKTLLAVVERPTDVLALEKTKRFRGVYLVLGEIAKTGALDPGQKLRLGRARFRGPFAEIILAFDHTTYADYGATVVARELEGCAPKITRLGRGIPTGGEIEFADQETLGGALENRG